MRTRHLAVVAVTVAALGAPLQARAWVVVRARPVVFVPMAPVYVAPVYATTTTVYVDSAPSPTPQAAPAITEKLPVNTTMWTLPSGCTPVSSSGTNFFVCGPNWLKAIPSDKGTYYAVVAPP